MDGAISSYENVGSGEPQGSVIGPLLFLIHIADIDFELCYSHAASFADDTRLLMKIKDLQDSIQFQSDLSSIYKWAMLNNMEFNNDEFRSNLIECEYFMGWLYLKPPLLENEPPT